MLSVRLPTSGRPVGVADMVAPSPRSTECNFVSVMLGLVIVPPMMVFGLEIHGTAVTLALSAALAVGLARRPWRIPVAIIPVAIVRQRPCVNAGLL